jgi:hypothetical protein
VDHPKLAIAGGLTLVGASFGEAIADAVELGAGLYKTVRKAFESHSAPLASNITKKISRQLGRRGWSAGDIDQTVNSPFTTRPSINRATGNRATAFYREDGSYVVRDDGTGDIVQISDRKSPSSWKPDRDVQNPYRP